MRKDWRKGLRDFLLARTYFLGYFCFQLFMQLFFPIFYLSSSVRPLTGKKRVSFCSSPETHFHLNEIDFLFVFDVFSNLNHPFFPLFRAQVETIKKHHHYHFTSVCLHAIPAFQSDLQKTSSGNPFRKLHLKMRNDFCSRLHSSCETFGIRLDNQTIIIRRKDPIGRKYHSQKDVRNGNRWWESWKQECWINNARIEVEKGDICILHSKQSYEPRMGKK